MAFFFSKKPASVAQDLSISGAGDSTPGLDTFEVELLGHLDTLYAVSCRMTRSTTEAEDLVQDTVVKAMRARDQFEPGTNLKAWLLRILTNTFINRYRRGGLERDILEGPDVESLTDGWIGATTMRGMRDPETAALAPLVEAEVQRALDDLPPEFRVAVVLSDIEELSYKEIAEAMGTPIGTVMSRLHRGRKLLQKTLRDHAVAMGIVSEGSSNKAEQAPTDLAAYRKRKRSAAV
ncbi:sigma-70 family RNA polymerase sigma factor [Polyangium sp. y55x31]|uniref:sigma-70 family RNA polymerase sigma factor n=1 Tax=Polyangium sp. y55x31 TaxID=3042688 RepID=UPI0024824A13|nr:sigma-70 family RNA polymerase sigma factor [Polyangium sp. y55x31]MDI1482257.1 sigma-70 family RNA polymerase sigma factor [Polyangium sp. y55x31]